MDSGSGVAVLPGGVRLAGFWPAGAEGLSVLRAGMAVSGTSEVSRPDDLHLSCGGVRRSRAIPQ
jgi:hypothetical protein